MSRLLCIKISGNQIGNDHLPDLILSISNLWKMYCTSLGVVVIVATRHL